MKKRTLTFILALLMLSAVFVSCGDGTADDTTAAQAAPTEEQVTTEAPETVAENIRDELPDTKNYNDEYVILSRKNTAYELESSDITGDIVKDAVTERNNAVEERFGVKINVVSIDGDWDYRDSFISAVKNSIASGKSEYDLISTHSAYIVNIGLQGLAYNMNSLSQIDFSKKWWSEVYAENVEIDGMVFSAVGDIDYSLYQYMMALFVNKKIATDYGITDIYSAVQDGTWTYENMMVNVKKVYHDENGNNSADQGDVFGLALAGHTLRMCTTVWDTQMTVKTDGVQTLNLPNDRFLDVYATLYDCIYNNTQNVFYNTNINTIISEFANDHILYLSERLGATDYMKDMTSEYGIIPFPKYNADQQEYISSSRDYMSAIAIPSNIDNTEMVGTVTEAMCMYGYQKITPQYYEITLKYKTLSDPTAVEMLDLIRDSLRHDFVMTFTNSIDLIYAKTDNWLAAGTKDVSKNLTSSARLWKKNIQTIYDTYAKLSQ